MILLRKLAIPALLLVGMLALAMAVASWRGRAGTEGPGGEWTCSMHPQVRQPKPGDCPICGMTLVPVAELAKEQAGIENRAGIFVEPIAHRELFKEIRTVGKLDYNEGQTKFITARINGRVDRVHVDFTGVTVKKNDHLVDIYSPADLILTVQSLVRALGTDDQESANLARERLRAWGITPDQIQEIEKSKKAKTHLTIYAPIGGTVIEKNIREGQYVKEGDVLYRIANLDPLWLYLDIYESELGWVRVGQMVDVTLESFPGENFRGKVVFIDPVLDERTRTVRARVNLPNPEQTLRPGMYASASIRVRLLSDGSPEPTGLEGKYLCRMHPEIVREKPGKCDICEMALEKVSSRKPLMEHAHDHHEHATAAKADKKTSPAPDLNVLAIPASAVLDTGRRRIAYRRSEDGAYELVELKLGPRAEGKDDRGKLISYFPVLAGLRSGDQVVVRGGFLLDSQRQIEGQPSLLYPQGQSATNLHAGHGASPAAPSSREGAHKH